MVSITNICINIILLGVVQGFFLAFVLLSNKNGNYQANRYLGMLLCAISTSIFNIFLLQTGLYHRFPYTLKFPANILLLFGPLFFFYIRSLVFRISYLQRHDLFHFMPALLVLARFLPFYFSDIATKTLFPSLDNIRSFKYEQYEYLTILICSQIHLWSYLLVVLRLLKQYQQAVKDYYSNIEKRNLNWIRFFISVFAVVYIIMFLMCTIFITVDYMISFLIVGVAVSIGIFILGYQGLRQTEIITLEPPLKKAKTKPAKLAKELVQSLSTKLNMLMNEERLFTDPDLNLDDLVKKLAVSRNTLSQFFRDYLKTSFFDYISRLRVEEMKRLLLDDEKEYMTIVALSNEAGFNSKPTLNRIFKQYTGMTPSEFRQRTRSEDGQD